MSKITVNTYDLRPTTMAAMIADLIEMPVVNAMSINDLVIQLVIDVGEEMAIEFLADVGVKPEQLATRSAA